MQTRTSTTEDGTMKLMDVLRKECVATGLSLPDKRSAIEAIAKLAAQSPALAGVEAAAIADALAKREEVGTTGFGKGIAIPHCRIEGVSEFVVGLASVPDGVDFESTDGKPVRLIVFIVGPADGSTTHIKLLSAISRVLSTEGAIDEMVAATRAEALSESFLRHAHGEAETPRDATRHLFQIFVQDEELFHEILEVFGGTEPRFTAVIEAENAGAYLAKMPLFAGLWSDKHRSFSKIILSLVDRRMTNEMIRRLEQITGPLKDSDKVLLAVQDIFYSGGSLTT